jgi:hypothetical protein
VRQSCNELGFASVLLLEPNTVIRHGEYMYVGPQVAGSITQFKVTADPRSGVSAYKFRSYPVSTIAETRVTVAEPSWPGVTPPSRVATDGRVNPRIRSHWR